MYIGKRIKELRQEKGWTQEVLAGKLGIPRTTLRNYETGTRPVPSKIVVELAKVFGVKTDFLFGLEDV